jgi:diaminohydroxyphosphoribosylaminopyrimidine deaminase/5-amino-6-(5-phosphoribosylamino)uracil reductase
MASAAEQAAMQRAIALSVAAVGTTNPNPNVGAVVLDAHGQVAGEGHTQPIGGDHAEVVALALAGEQARGGTLVVTLEPCRHTGRTGPCTAAVVAAGIARVVYAVDDPDGVAGGGAGELRDRGIDVESGVLVEAATVPIEPWLVGVGRHRAHLTWKYAATLDGRTAAADGTSRWITGSAARVDVHRERARVDAVIVGIGTVLADDPELTVREWPSDRQPLRVVVDGTARTPTTARILDASAPTLVAVGGGADESRITALRSAGADVICLPRIDGRIDLEALLAALFDRGVRIGLVEGGATLAASFVRQRLIDRVVGYHAPALLGAGRSLLGGLGIETISQTQRLQLDDVSRIGNDVRVIARMCGETAEGHQI